LKITITQERRYAIIGDNTVIITTSAQQKVSDLHCSNRKTAGFSNGVDKELRRFADMLQSLQPEMENRKHRKDQQCLGASEAERKWIKSRFPPTPLRLHRRHVAQ
jgi:hypothetical protein